MCQNLTNTQLLSEFKNYLYSLGRILMVSVSILLISINLVNAQNPLVSASGFNIVTEGNLTITQGDIEGAIAVGGNLNVLGNSQRTSANATGGVSYVTYGGLQYALVVGGGLSGVNGGNIFKVDGKGTSTTDHYIRFNTLSGSTAAAGSGGIDIGNPVTNNLNRYVRVNNTAQTATTVVNTTSLFNFATAFTDFRAQSVSLSSCTGNVTPSGTGNVTLNLGANSTNVWNVTGTSLNSYNSITLTGNLPSATRPLVINVNAAGTFNWNNLKFNMGSESDNYMEINRAPYIIWNFYNTTTLSTNNAQLLLGSILAPDANFTANASGNITGQVIVKTYTKPQAGEIHIAKFNASLSCTVACSNVTDPGVIGSNESFCGTSLNPSLITNITSPSGGSGALEYIWLISYDGGTTNTSISGATNDTYDPPTISQTTWYRRCSRRAGCSSYDGESNWVIKELSCCNCVNNLVTNNSFEYGTTGWDYSGGNFAAGTGAVYCGTKSGDFQITNTSSNWVSQEIFPTSLAAGTTLNVSVYAGTHDNTYYQEVFVDYFDANWNWLSNTAVEVNKVLSASPVGPQLYTFTSTIPSGVGHISIGFSGNGNWIKTDNWCVTMGAVCNNVTSAGSIGNDETLCGTSVNPANIVNISLPSGGNTNTLEYVWIMTTDPNTPLGTTWNVTTIAGATGSSYDPPVITQTTWYRRCARRQGCTSYDGESNWVKKELTSCCTATINGLQFKDPTGVNTTVTSIVNGGTYSIASLSSPFNVEALLTGNMESVRFTLSGSATGGNIENAFTWDYAGSGSSWPHGAGTFTMLVEAFPVDNAVGSICASQTYTFTLVDCNNLTSGGTIGYDESLCGISVDPSNIVNVTSPSGGTGTIEYMWLVSTNAGTNYTAIAGASSATYDPGPITQTTWYRRCARNFGCTSWVGESNWVMKEVKAPVTANAGTTTTLTCTSPSTTLGVSAIAGNTYSWSPATGLSSTTIAQPIASPIATTTYTITVTGANGCTATSSVLINVNKTSPIAVAGTASTITCTTLSATLGTTTTAGYTYSWSPATGLSSTTISQPVATPTTTTTYTVTVTGSNGCTATSAVTVTVNKTPPTANAGVAATLTCSTTSAIIGSAPLAGNTYSWSPTTGLSSSTIAQPTATPTSTTTYTVTVTGANGCTASSSVTVTVNTSLPTANAGSASTLTCITTSATLGTTSVAGYTYSWSPSSGLSSTTIAQPIATPITTTTYTVTVTNSNGCTASSAVTITVNKTPPTANAGSTATLTCSTTSTTIGTTAIAGNTYSWSPATGLSSTTIAQPTASPTTTTTYTVTVTAANGCTATSLVVINVNTAPPVANAGSATTLTCTSSSTLIGTTALAGNSYSWSPSTGLNSVIIAQPTANPTTTTTYTVTVTGSNGCTATSSVTITVNQTPPTVNAGSPVTLTCTTTTATIGSASVAGYSYSWSPASGLSSSTIAQPTANPTATTTYTLTVTGSNGCTSTGTVIVTVNKTLPTANAGNAATLTCTSSSTTIGTVSIVGNTYSWSPSTGLSSTTVAQPIANPTTTTTYTVTVTGSNGCTATSAVTITVNNTPPTANAGVDRNLNCITTSANIGSAAIAGNTYSWAPSTGLSSTTIAQPLANPTVTTNYTVTVTGANGCTATDVVIVNVDNTPPTANAGTDGLVNCSINSVTLGTASVAGYTYNWNPFMTLSSNNVAQPTANPNSTTTYTLTVTGTNGCTATDMVVVTVNVTPPSADAGIDKIINCTTPSAVIGTTPTAGTSNTYSWSPATGLSSTSIAQPTATPSVTTTYTVTVTGTNGCTSTDAVMVSVSTGLPIANAGADKEVCSTNSVVIGTSAIAGNTYSWLPTSGLSASNIAQPTANPSTTTNYTVTVTASNGCSSTDVVTVSFKEGSVGNYVWSDLNANGLNDEISSAGINGISVQLWTPGIDNIQGNTDDQLISTTTTANDASSNPGYYNFKICTTGNYYVKFPTTSSSNPLTTQTTTAATDNNSDANLTTGNSPVFAINTSGSGVSKDNNTIDAGYSPLLSLGNTVWVDANKNGIKDGTEIGMNGATVNLYADNNSDGSPDGAAIATTTTNASGLYIFNNVVPGNYVVGVVPATPTSGNSFVSSPVNEANPNSNVDNNDNGVTTTAGQTYSGTITLLAGTEPTGETPNNGTALDASSNLTLDFGFYQPVNISGNVFVDNNGPTNVDGTGIGSLSTTQLYANLIGASGTVVAVVPVNPNGTYNFLDVTPNTNYTMVLSSVPGTVGNSAPATTLPSGWTNVSEDCCDNTGNDGTTNGITFVNVGTSDVTNVNFGVREVLSMGNMVWNDLNKNGLKDATEIGIPGATVKLYNDANSDGTADGPAIATTTTNSNGLYAFNDLYAGNYIIGVTPPTPTTGNDYESSTVGQETNPNLNVDNNDNGIIKVGGETVSGTITLSLGAEPTGETPANGTASDANSNLTIDFGFYQPVNISGNVFVDNNGPTNVDGTGIGAPSGIQLYANLVNSTGTVDAVVPVNPNGTYYFADVRPNTTFTMVLSTVAGTLGSTPPAASLPTGWSNVSEDCCDNTGNDGTTNGITSITVALLDVPNVNFGIKQTLSLGNLVWNDLNKNGLKDASEVGITGATVKLYADANLDGTPDGASIASTTTNSNGFYVFNDLVEGSYVIGVTPPAVTSGNAFASSPINEANPNLNVDNNDNGIVTVAGETRSGTVTLALGTEPIGETPNNGTGSDANSNLTVDFGFYQAVNISGNVFVDNNGPTNVDGTGISNPSGTQVYANLINSTGNVVAVVPVNSNGTYSFMDVTPNTSYTMVLSTVQGTVGSPAPSSSLPNGWSNVSEDCCDNTGNDGTTNGITSLTVGFTDVTNVNFGIREIMSLGNLVWNDLNKNGLKDASEVGITGATVKLYADANLDGTPDGAAIATTTTNSNGYYVFNDLVEGSYVIGVTPPVVASGNAFASSPINETNPNLNVDNNDNGIATVAGETRSGTITLALGTEPTGETPDNGTGSDANSNLSVDFGFYQPVNISGNVYVDNNGPANVDGIGIGTPGGTQIFANLINSAGNVVAVVPVNSNGTYSFLDVTPNSTYTMVLSTTQGTVGSPAPLASLPNGWTNVSEDCCDNTGNDGTTNGIVSVTVGFTNVTNVNFGIREPLSLGNLVWNDINRNGLKETSENGIAGATVKLYADANLDGAPDGASIATTTSNSNGLYIFNDLIAGSYIVGVTPPVPAIGNDYESSIVGEESNPNLNVDNNDNGIIKIGGETVSGTITLALGTEPTGETPNNGTASDVNSNLTVDFGFYQPVNISGNVFVDNNGPTNVDGTGIGAPNGTQLYANLVNASGLVDAVVPVNPTGTYFFADVRPNTTFTMVLSTVVGTIGSVPPVASLPGGWSNVSEDCCDNTGNDGTTNGITTVTVGLTDVPNVNFGIRQPLSLGNLVWEDANRDGLKDASENGITGATVNLYLDANNDGTPDGAAIQTTTTGSTGLYIFNGLDQGNYIIGVVPPTGNVYTSSVNGQEVNPNLNIDNNDNGIVTIGGETRSGTVILAANSEPTGELPNNGSAPDANSNLTVDFGFFICPSGFTFNPQYVCPGNTLNLTALEPVNYTGGVWSQGGVPVSSTNVTVGTYVYTFSNGTCTSTGTVTVGTNVPDYTPTISIAPSAITGTQNVRVIINISEILNKPSCSDIYIFVPRLEPRFTFTYEPTATIMGGIPVANAEWQYFTSNPNFYVWKYIGAATFPANGSSKLGFIGPYNPTNTDGETSFSVQIFQGSGGENNINNNIDSENLIYFR